MARIIFPVLLLCLSVSSCRLYDGLFKGDVVARAGKDVLYRSEVEALNISGFSPEDSAAMVERYIRSWARNRLLLEVAESRLSKEDRNVTAQLEEYRRQLLVYRYEQQYVEQRLDTVITEEQYREYYEAHPASFVTHVPLMRGWFIKVSDSSPNLNPIKSLYRARGVEDSVRLEDLCYTSADKYFRLDSWTGLDIVAEEAGVPVQELSAVLDSRPWFEHNWMGYTYLIAVHDYVPEGGAAPYDYSRDRIRNLILSRRKQELVTSLERNVLNDAIASDKFIIY